MVTSEPRQNAPQHRDVSAGRLVLTPQPHLTECISGYLHTLSKANGYPSPTYITRALKRSGKLVYLRLVDPRFLRDVTGMDDKVAERLGFRPENIKCRRTMRLLGKELHVSEARMDVFRICPLCVADHGRHEAAWHLRMLDWCPVHRVRLLERCDRCDSELVWNRPGIGSCRCGADLTTQGGRELCPESLGRLLEALSQTLYSGRGGRPFPPELAYLQHLDLYWLSRLVTHLCREIEAIPSEHKCGPAELITHERLVQVAEALDRWPDNFRAFLNRRYGPAMQSDSGDGARFRDFFHWVFVYLGKNIQEKRSSFYFIRDEVLRFGAQYLPRERLIRGDQTHLPVEVKWGSVLEAAALADMDPRTLASRIKAGEVPHVQSGFQKRNRNVLVDLDWIRKWKVSRYRSVDPRVAAEILEVTPALLKALRTMGVYRAEHRTLRVQGYAEEDVEAFSRVLKGLATLHSKDGTVGGIEDDGVSVRGTKSVEARARMLGRLVEKHPTLWDGGLAEPPLSRVGIEVDGHLEVEIVALEGGRFGYTCSNSAKQSEAATAQELVARLWSDGFSADDLTFRATFGLDNSLYDEIRQQLSELPPRWIRPLVPQSGIVTKENAPSQEPRLD